MGLLRQEKPGVFTENDDGELFVNRCLIMLNSLLHRSDHCKNVQPYIVPVWTDGTNWSLTQANYYGLWLKNIMVLLLYFCS